MDGIEPFEFDTTTSISSDDSFSTFRYEDSSTIYTTSTPPTSASHPPTSTFHLPNDEIYSNPNIYDYSEIRAATNNFFLKPLSSSKHAWHCIIREQHVVVIRRKLHRSSIDISEIEDKLSAICQSYHEKVIKLLGASVWGDCIFLVYDDVRYLNLANCLRNPNLNMLQSWISRMRISIDIAQGLEHIHHYMESGMSIVHNRLNSRSVIVIGQFCKAKICHFGTAELCGEIFIDQIEESEIEERRCYIAPELIAGGIISQKSDVFAFGVLLLEILSGEEPVKEVYDEESGDYRKISLIDSARDAIESKEIAKIRQLIDKRVWNSDMAEEWAEKMMRIGLECVHVDPDKRPLMPYVTSTIQKLYFSAFSGSLPDIFPIDLGRRIFCKPPILRIPKKV